jgi:hypothetical protein
VPVDAVIVFGAVELGAAFDDGSEADAQVDDTKRRSVINGDGRDVNGFASCQVALGSKRVVHLEANRPGAHLELVAALVAWRLRLALPTACHAGGL